MYDYEYEEDVLISLQMLKYLHDNNPEGFQSVLDGLHLGLGLIHQGLELP